jgi:hypothetical protein
LKLTLFRKMTEEEELKIEEKRSWKASAI